jgi:NOL1/NOP2/fmu family ribosome biogenesis protein
VRIWPHHVQGEGHFIAVLRRVDSGAGEKLRPYPIAKIPSEAARLIREFRSQHLNADFDFSSLALSGTYLYQLPQSLPVLEGLKVIHPGWWLGTVKKGRFEPAHALALALGVDKARQAVRLASDGPEVLAYLRGETLNSEGEDGWLLVAVDGFPLGWGKRVGGVVKNYYPKGLRR